MSDIFLLKGDKLKVTTSAACSVDVVVFLDQGHQEKHIVDADTVEVMVASGPCPIQSIFITNTHATDSVTVTPLMTVGGASFNLHGATVLAAGQKLSFVEGAGFVVPTQSAKLDMMRYVTADSIHALAHTAAVITGLTPFPVLLGHRYAFEAQFFHVANATTSGAEFFVGGVAATYIILGSQSVVTAGVATTTMSSGVVTAVDTAAILQTTSSTAATVPSYVAGTIIPSADGDLSFKASSEIAVAAGLTVKKGSWAWLRETDN